MDADFPGEDETSAVIGCAFDVINELGCGLHKKPYENAMVVEFGRREIPHAQQVRFPVIYKGVKVGEYIPDLIAFGRVIVDTKAIKLITDVEMGQMLNHLKITGLPVGLIINFKNSRLEYRRVVPKRGD